MRAAKRFVRELEDCAKLARTASIQVDLYGSLALTGRGHRTDSAILMGLCGEEAHTIDPATIDSKVARISQQKTIKLLGTHLIGFNPENDLRFRNEVIPGQPNAMRFTAYASEKKLLSTELFYSIGGGSIVAEHEAFDDANSWSPVAPCPFTNAADLLRFGRDHGKAIWEIMLANEEAIAKDDVTERIFRFWMVMNECMSQGFLAEGVLPGTLKVQRRAPNLYRRLTASERPDLLSFIDWISLFAIAVSEENAAGNRIVTAPTNGAAGVLPAVAHYYRKFVERADEDGLVRFFLTAGAIAILYKLNASISGAEVGCQGEIGVACSMAAAGLVAAQQGTNEQIEHAAEIGMEHTLGMSCDPVGGLVQIPCIERNAFGAVKAVTSARMAMAETGEHKVSLDQVIRTMLQTGKDMKQQYKETSLGGLAINVIEC